MNLALEVMGFVTGYWYMEYNNEVISQDLLQGFKQTFGIDYNMFRKMQIYNYRH